jgi:hypothetical protein
LPVDLQLELVDGRASCLLRAVHTGSSPAQEMARGNPIATHASIVRARRAVRGVGRKGSTCTQLCPDISPGTRRRPRRRSHRGQEATPSGSAGGELPGPRRGLRGSQRHWGGPPQPAWTAGGTRSRRSNPRRFPSTRGPTGTTTTPPASSYTLALLGSTEPRAERAVRRPAARWVGQPWMPWSNAGPGTRVVMLSDALDEDQQAGRRRSW